MVCGVVVTAVAVPLVVKVATSFAPVVLRVNPSWLSVRVMEPVSGPEVGGVNSGRRVQLAAAATVAVVAQVPAPMMKFELAEAMAEKESAALPVLTRLVAIAALLLPWAVVGKLSGA